MSFALIQKVNDEQKKSAVVDARSGDTVRVHQKIKEGQKERIQVFEGIVIARHGGRGINGTFTVRKIASGVGVEKSFLIHAPNIVKIEFKKASKVRRAKLYYLRDLSGKSLRMKDKKLDKDVWELIARGELKEEEKEEAEAPAEGKKEEKEPSGSDAAEAGKADKKKKPAHQDKPDTEPKAEDGKILEGEKEKEAKKDQTDTKTPTDQVTGTGAGEKGEKK